METGPNISSGVLNLDIRYSNALFSLNAYLSLRATKLLATPGGPNRKILSPGNGCQKGKGYGVFFLKHAFVEGIEKLSDTWFYGVHAFSIKMQKYE